jgi:hypothetical protein
MKKKTLYNKTVGILVDAYFNDTLQHQICQACAVGNLVAYYTNQKQEGKFYCKDWSWSGVVRNYFPAGSNEKTIEIANKQVAATGYTAIELLAIEKAFESSRLTYPDPMFNGLMAVIDVLDKIHENTDTILTANTKLKFNKVAALPL